LLKTLEEPAGRVILVLTATDVEAVPATIASRCETLTLRSVSIQALSEAMQRQGIAADRARLAAEASDGRPSLARRMLEDPALLEARGAYRQALEQALRLDLAGRFALAESWKDDAELRARLAVWISILRSSLRLAWSGGAGEGARSPVLDSLSTEARRAALEAALEAAEALDRNANARLTAEALLLQFPRA
jgi:DNA polymerase-3 subunit delta'